MVCDFMLSAEFFRVITLHNKAISVRNARKILIL